MSKWKLYWRNRVSQCEFDVESEFHEESVSFTRKCEFHEESVSSTVCILQGKCDFSQGRKALVSKSEFYKESVSFTVWAARS